MSKLILHLVIKLLTVFVYPLDCVDGKSNDKHVCCFPVQIGTVLKKLFEDNVVKREELFITSKLWYIVLCRVYLIHSLWTKCSFNHYIFKLCIIKL